MDERRLIDAEAFGPHMMAVAKSKGMYDDCLYTVLDELSEAPTVDPVVHAQWVLTRSGVYKCTRCGMEANKYQRLLWDYCPKCGAAMWRAGDGNDRKRI